MTDSASRPLTRINKHSQTSKNSLLGDRLSSADGRRLSRLSSLRVCSAGHDTAPLTDLIVGETKPAGDGDKTGRRRRQNREETETKSGVLGADRSLDSRVPPRVTGESLDSHTRAESHRIVTRGSPDMRTENAGQRSEYCWKHPKGSLCSLAG